MPKSVPDFIVIGAMKAGTTSLYADLKARLGVFLPERKELNLLNNYPSASLSSITAKYRKYYNGCGDGRVAGEISTQYTKYPSYNLTPYTASKLFPKHTKIVYMVRCPLERLRSQHHHEFPHGQTPANIGEAIMLDHRLVAYSSYYLQLTRWLDYFPASNVSVLPFERYVQQRSAVLSDLLSFIGADNKDIAGRAPIENVSAERVVYNDVAAWFARSLFYRERIRPLLDDRKIQVLKRAMSSKGPATERPEIGANVEVLANRLLASDLSKFLSLIGAASYDEVATNARFNFVRLGEVGDN